MGLLFIPFSDIYILQTYHLLIYAYIHIAHAQNPILPGNA